MNETITGAIKPWMLWWHEGLLLGKGTKGTRRIKSFIAPLRQHMSSLPGCNFEGRQFMRLQGVEDSDGSLTLLIHDSRNESTQTFKLRPEEKCGIVQKGRHGMRLAKEALLPFISFYCAPRYSSPKTPSVNKLALPTNLPAGLVYDMMIDGIFSWPSLTVIKKIATSPSPRRAVALYNDGVHLYLHQPDNSSHHLLFSEFRRNVPVYMFPGFNFSELPVVFKTNGHTLNGYVGVTIRHLHYNWSLTLYIAPKTIANVYDVGNAIRVGFKKIK